MSWNAPQECPNEAALKDGIEAYLGQSLSITREQPLAISANVISDGGRYTARLRFQTRNGVEERALDHPDCAKLLDAAALVVALAIDPVRLPPPKARAQNAKIDRPRSANAVIAMHELIAKWSTPWCLLLAMGCEDSHVGLHAPPRTAPLPERIRSYEQLRDESRTELVYIAESGQEVGRVEGDLHLANGAKIVDPADILPVVAEDSAAAGAAREYRDLDGYMIPLNYVIVGGVAVGIVGLSTIPFVGEENQKLVLLGGVVSIVAGVGTYIATSGMRKRYHDAGMKAFGTYRQGLQRRLGVCEVEKTLIDCDFLEPVPGKASSPR